MDEHLSLKETARRVGVPPSTLRRWAQSGVIPEVDGSGRWGAAALAASVVDAVSGASHLDFEETAR